MGSGDWTSVKVQVFSYLTFKSTNFWKASSLFFLFLGNSLVSLMLMTGWSKFRSLVFPFISGIRDDPITFSCCSWNWNRFDFHCICHFSFVHQNVLPKYLDRTFLKEESEHFLLLRVTSQLRQMTSLKRETSDEVDFFKKKLITLLTLSKICIIP